MDIVQLFIGILIGIAVAMPFFIVSVDNVVDFIRENSLAVITFVMVATVFLLLLLALRNVITRWIAGIVLKGPADLARQATDLASAVAAGDVETVRRGGGDLAVQVAAYYGWMLARRLILALIIAFGGLLAGVIGSALLVQQNRILEAQNRNLDLQLRTSLLPMMLQEANRRVPLYSQLTSIFARIDEEVAAAQANDPPKTDPDEAGEHYPQDPPAFSERENRPPFEPVLLSARLYSDIIGLSLQLKPYLHFDSLKLDMSGVGQVAAAPEKIFERLVFLSPERGMLLRYLIENRVKLDEDALSGADFTYSDLRGFRVDSGLFTDFDPQKKMVDPERFVCFYSSGHSYGKTLEVGFSIAHSDLSQAFVSGISFDPTNIVIYQTEFQHTIFTNGRNKQQGIDATFENSSFYDVEFSPGFIAKFKFVDSEWRAFDQGCAKYLLDPENVRIEVSGFISLFPVEVFSDGMWNMAMEDIREAFDRNDYSKWISAELTEFLSKQGIEVTVLGLPDEHQQDSDVPSPGSFGFRLTQ